MGLIERLAGLRVLVVGDAMLDEYVGGDADRISPEAPVPIVRVTGTTARPGGAANVALNVTTLGAAAELATVLGDDAAGEQLAGLCARAGIGTTLAVRSQVKGRDQIRPRSKRYAPGAAGLKTDGQDLKT